MRLVIQPEISFETHLSYLLVTDKTVQMFRFVIFVFALSACSAVDPECYMNTTQLIAENGFESEAHFATTDDGYILQIFRIKPRRGKVVNYQI